MIAYMHKWKTVPMASADPAEGKMEAPRLMKKIYDNFCSNSAEKKRLFFYGLQERKPDNEVIERHMIMSNLKYDGSILFGSIGIISKRLDGLIRERDIITYEEAQLVPSSPSKGFEFYTYFAICVQKSQMLILKNGDLPNYIDNIVVRLCLQAIEGEPYTFEAESYQEQTIRDRIEELNKARVELRIASSDLDFQDKPSIKRLKAKSENRGATSVSMKLSFNDKLDQDVIDTLVEISDDKDTQRLVVVDASAPSKEADSIDLLKEIMKVKRDIKIKKSEINNIDLVWNKFKETMNQTSTDEKPK